MDTGAKSNFISASALLFMGKNIPKLRFDHVYFTGANGSKLEYLGCISLTASLGDSEYLMDFHVVDDLATTAIIGSNDLTRLHAKIDCAAKTLTFSDGNPLPLQPAGSDLPVYCTDNIKLEPGEHKFVSCKPRRKVNIGGTYFVTPEEKYSDCGPLGSL